MKQKRIISFTMSFILAISLLFTPNLEVKAISKNDVVSQLNSYISQYNGKTANSNQMYMGSQCKGFANWIFLKIFGVYIGPYPESANYKISNPNAQTVGIIEPGNLNADTAKSLLQKGVPGDYIQVQRSTARGRGPHSMILVGVNGSGIEVFDCNSDGKNTIKKYSISWSAFDTANRAMSLYHAHNYTVSSSAPSNPQISKSQHWYDLQDRIEISAYADGATSYFMSMFKNGNKIISQGVDGGKFSMDAKKYGKGDYSAYFSCTNSAGTVDTKWIDFSVVGAAAYSDVRASDYWYDLTDTVSITVDTVCAKGQVIGIDKEGVGRVITESTEPTYKIAASKLGVGKYSAYFSVYNGSGGVDTKRVEFSIVGAATYRDVRVSNSWYDLTDTVSIMVDTVCAKGQVIGIDKEGVGRVVTESTKPTYKIAASKLGVGKYSAYFSVYNGSGGVDTKRIEFEIVNAPQRGAIVSSSKKDYDLEDKVQITVLVQHSKYQWIGIDKEGEGRIITEKITNGKYQIPASKLGKGKYSAFFTVCNNSGGYDTSKVEFSIGSEMHCNHNYISEITIKPVCDISGVKTYICTKCGKSYTETIPQTGHTWDAGKVTLKATETTDGIYTYTCTSCGDTKTEKIPATGQAGDNNQDDKDNPDKDKTGLDAGNTPDENDADPDREETPNVEEEPDILEVGDVVEDVSSGDEYEIISMNGGEICVEYMESANSKAAIVKIPATIKTENGTVCKVTSISKGAFKNNKKLKKIVIGNNVKVIGTKAFSGCKNLTSVSIGKNVVTIGANAFSGCTRLTNLTIPSKVEKIGSHAFSGCKKLKKLNIKTSKLKAKRLNKKAFKGIPAKTVIQVPKDKQKSYKKVLCQKGLGRKNKIR